MPPTDHTRTRDGDAGTRIANQLRLEILDGILLPGERIRQEDLQHRFGGSRVPVREALSTLMNEGLVTIKVNSGAWVSSLTLTECEEIYQMRERLEPLLLRYSAPLLEETDLERLEQLAAEADEASQLGDIEAFMQFDREFHLASYVKASTQHIGSLITKLWNSTAPYRRAYISRWSPELRQIANDEHRILIVSLREGDFTEAERILDSHIRRTRRQLAKYPEIFDTGYVNTSG